MTPPKFVRESTDASFVWIEADDSLYHTDGTLCDDENGLKFWIANCKIRNAFHKLRAEIEFGENVKVNVSKLATLAEVERVSLYHHRRKWWVKDQLRELDLLKGRLSREKIHKEIKELRVIEDLKLRLKLSREQVAQLTFEKTEMLHTIASCERKIRAQEKVINRLSRASDS